MQDMITWFTEKHEDDVIARKFKRVDRYFYTTLMKPSSRTKDRFFMIDYDSKDNKHSFKGLLEDINIDIELIQETRNGYHFKVRPFNRMLIDTEENHKKFDFEVKTDALFFVEYLEVKK